ncbi:4875_t:CDS:1, partial [Funneliformis geosporum]
NLPISAIPSVFDLEKDVNYRVLLRDDIQQSYYDHEEYQEKIANRS